ncbi:Hsp20/alpha crystallin family protein [Natrinema longum]|uniref:Hsp20/alpha crystallin family protein n=1 Tax=Natrinema longum TaxID=370324 RepID=A0A8A2U9N2_9EURY|nr:Hsp20/alpha crystallin family protein [Natrinema longum]MBZ6494047.1 Hsp20/alpha crystallin family protein [Natrinema longum]QSW84618.1 Hsp20/alpha crystallin family protein [Natrinema longum]
MSDRVPPDDRDESDDDHRSDDSRIDDDEHWLSSLLSALESLESGSTSTSGRRRGDRAIFDYDISIRSGDDLSADDSPLGSTPSGGEERRGRDGDRSRTRRIRSSGPSSDHTVSTRRYDDELVVTADVAGADPDDVTVGFDESMLVIAVEGRELDRIEIPWRENSSEAMMKNGVLTVRVRPGTAESEDGDETAETGADETTEDEP